MRELTGAEIERLASRRGVRKVAVENFLMTLGYAGSASAERRNLYADARSYGWNAATEQAILDGIELAYGGVR